MSLTLFSSLDGFQRLTQGHDAGGYYHELFLRGKTFLCKQMTRTKVKGTGFKAASSPDEEPDFWHMPPINPVTPPHSSGDEDEEASTHSESEPSFRPTFSPVRSKQSVPTSFAFEAPQPDKVVSQKQAPVEEMAIEPIPLQAVSDSDSSTSSEVLDEVVDELFLHEAPEENDNILDFVNTWIPNENEEQIEDDLQLGMLLEQVLWE